LISNDTTKAEASETVTIDASQIQKLDMYLFNGDITVLHADTQEITLELFKTSWGSSVEQAEARLANLDLEQTISGNKLELSFMPHGNYALSFGRQMSPRIDTTLYIPDGLEIQLTSSGEIFVQGIDAELEIRNQFGEVSIEDFKGNLFSNNSNNKVTLNRIDAAGENIEIINNYGEITVQNLQANSLLIDANNAGLIVYNVDIEGECKFNNQYDLTEVSEFSCWKFSIETNGSYISLENGSITSSFSAAYQYADLTMEQVLASSYSFEFNGGDLTIDGIQGEVKVTGQFGEVAIEDGELVTLDIENQNGGVSFIGSLNPDIAHTVETTYGDIQLFLPEDSSFDFHLEAAFGNIDSEFPLILTGEFDAEELRGMINQGGPLLTVTTQSANIEIIILATYNN
jgi:DUF4097 and DUF4098 domain-containing protein YvlB